MKIWHRFLAAVLTLGICVSALTACRLDESPPDDEGKNTDPSMQAPDRENDQEKPDNTDETPIISPTEALLLTKDQASDYVIVCDDAIDTEAEALIQSFRIRFWEKTKTALPIARDTDAPRKQEILIYTMDDRAEVSTMMKKINAPRGNGFYIGLLEQKVVVACQSVMYLELALDLLCEAVSPCADDAYGLPRDYVGRLDIPEPIRGWQSQIQSFYTGERNYTVSVNDITKKNYLDYCAVLEESFTKYSDNQIGENLFATYVADHIYGKMAIYTMYYPNDGCYKITYGPLRYLPELTPVSRGDHTVIPSITQHARGGSRWNGMCSIVQLTDGRFVLFDGGPYSATNEYSKDDLKNLYQLLSDMTPGDGLPVVAGWFFSHAHSDHMQLAVHFVRQYHGQFELQMVGYNFPDFDSVTILHETTSDMKRWVDAFREAVDLYYPQAKTWVVHTGEVLKLPGCTLEVVYTPEDYATNPQLGALTNGIIQFPWGNHSCAIFRLTVNTTTFLVLGDAEKTLCKWMADNYKTEMKSDILSLSHHGLNGGELSFYQYIDPDICFWPTCTETMISEKCTKHDFNQYLLNIGGYGTRDREHYPADVTTTIYC